MTFIKSHSFMYSKRKKLWSYTSKTYIRNYYEVNLYMKEKFDNFLPYSFFFYPNYSQSCISQLPTEMVQYSINFECLVYPAALVQMLGLWGHLPSSMDSSPSMSSSSEQMLSTFTSISVTGRQPWVCLRHFFGILFYLVLT